MRTIKFSPVMRALAVCVGALAFTGSHAAGDKTAYDNVRATAKSSYEAAKTKCDAMNGNAKDICVAEAKAVRTKAEVDAEAVYKDTPKAREHALTETAAANYKVAKERCDDKTGNDKDVCIKVAKAVQVKAKADAKAARVSTSARMDASDDKRKADYQVAAERCDALSGDAKGACVKDAKAKFGQ